MNKIYVIYHSADMDGFCSGTIAKMHLLDHEKIQEENIEMVGWDYGNPVPEIPNGSRVIMTDISFTPDNMLLLALHCELEWIDHHKTAIEDSIKFGYETVAGIRKVGDSASLLAWKWWFGQNIPSAVYYVDRYDVWKQNVESGCDWEAVLHAQYGMRNLLGNPSDITCFEQWRAAIDHSNRFYFVLRNGETCYEYERKTNVIRCSKAFDLEFEGLNFAAINNVLAGSLVLESYVEEHHDGILVFGYEGKKSKWKVSLYGNNKGHDLSAIAKNYGGGGHADACGFLVDDIQTILKK